MNFEFIKTKLKFSNLYNGEKRKFITFIIFEPK